MAVALWGLLRTRLGPAVRCPDSIEAQGSFRAHVLSWAGAWRDVEARGSEHSRWCK